MSEQDIAKTSRNALIATIVSIMLSPLSVGLGYYLDHIFKKPEFVLKYANHQFYYWNNEFSPKAIRALKECPDLVSRIKEVSQRSTGTPDENCFEWIDGNGWSDMCVEPVRRVINGFNDFTCGEEEAIRANIQKLKKWNPRDQIPDLTPMKISQREYLYLFLIKDRAKTSAINSLIGSLNLIKKDKAALQCIIPELSRIENERYKKRSGQVDFSIGMLNQGDADGVVYNSGKITFGGMELPLKAKEYTAVKAHSFQEIIYEVDEEHAEKGALKKWEKGIANKSKVSYSIEIKTEKGNVKLEEVLADI